jgi:hypothetical protein
MLFSKNNKCNFADVLVSKAIRDNNYTKFENNDLGQKIDVVHELQQIFCTQAKKEIEVSTRKSVMRCGTF